VVKIGKNTEGVNKPTETDFKEISSDIWRKVVKIGKNTEGVLKLNIIKKAVFTTTKNKKKPL
jgi:hypothetical protein